MFTCKHTTFATLQYLIHVHIQWQSYTVATGHAMQIYNCPGQLGQL